MSNSFRVDFDRFVYPKPTLDPDSVLSPEETLKRKENSRFFHYHGGIKKAVKAYEKKGKPKIQLLEIIQKVISVFSALLSILMPLAIFYLPSWAPWGIGLPTILLSIYAQGKIHASIQKNKMDAEFIPCFNEMIGQRSYRSLHPIGSHDLLKLDPRLKSDKMMRHEVEKPMRRSAQSIEEVIGSRSRKDFHKYGLPDLEMSSFVQQTAASAFSSGVPLRQFRETLKEARTAIVPQELESWQVFEARMIDQKRAAYEGGDQILMFPQSNRAQPHHSPREQAHSLVLLYDAFGKQFEQAKSSYQEWDRLYEAFRLQEEKVAFPLWKDYETLANKLQIEIAPLVELFYKESSPEEFKRHLTEIKNKHAEPLLYFLIEQSKKIKQKLDAKIAEHPFKKHEAIQKQLITFLEKDCLSKDERLSLTEWMQSYPEGSKKKILELPHQAAFPKELKEWFQRHPDSRNLTAHDLLEQTDKIKKRVVAALEKFYFMNLPKEADSEKCGTGYQSAIRTFLLTLSKLKNFEKKVARYIKKEDPFSKGVKISTPSKSPYFPNKEIQRWLRRHGADSTLTAKELLEKIVGQKEQALRDFEQLFQIKLSPELTYPILNEKLDHFKKETLVPLKRLIDRGGLSNVGDYLKLLFFKIPAQPFKTGNSFSKRANPELYQAQPYFDKRRVAEIQLDRKLKAVDQKMLAVNQARVWALRAPTYLLFAIEGIVSLYFSSPWIFWGFSALAVLAEGASYYVNERLKLMEKKKEGIKLQYQLRNRPNIDFIPGNRPELKRLKEVQQKYDLDGVAPTWSRALAEGDGFLKTPSREEAVKMAKRGSEKAGRYIDNTLISLKSEMMRAEKPFRKLQIKNKIDYLEQGSGSAQAIKFLENSQKFLEMDAANLGIGPEELVKRIADFKEAKKAVTKPPEDPFAALSALPWGSLLFLPDRLKQQQEIKKEEESEYEKLMKRIAYIDQAKKAATKPSAEELKKQETIRKEAEVAKAVHKYGELYANKKIKYATWIEELQKEIKLFEVSEKVLKKELGDNWIDLFLYHWIESPFVVKDQVARLLKAAEGERAQLVEGATFNLIDAIKSGDIELLSTLEKERLLKIAHHMAHLRRMINFFGSKEAILQRTLKCLFREINLEKMRASEEEREDIAIGEWRKREGLIKNLFQKLSPRLQRKFYKKIPEPFFTQFRPFYESYTGIAFCKILPKNLQNLQALEEHWKTNQEAMQEEFNKIGPIYRTAIHRQLPDFLKTKLDIKETQST